MFGDVLEALTNQGWPRAWNSQERLAELNLTKEMDKACFDFSSKVWNLYSTLTGQIAFQLCVSFPEPTDLVCHFSFVIKCYVTFMLFTKCHSCLRHVINFPRAGAVVHLLSICSYWGGLSYILQFLKHQHLSWKIPTAHSSTVPLNSHNHVCRPHKKPFLHCPEKKGFSENETTSRAG